MSGRVLIHGQPATKPGHSYPADIEIKIKPGAQYVSRGGLKLESVVEKLGIDFKNKVVLDVGASTGGFTDLALQQGAAKVYAVDVGKSPLAHKLRTHPRVVAMEKTDIRDVTLLRHPERTKRVEGSQSFIPEPIDLALVDVSFISLRLVLPAVVSLLAPGGVIVSMAKPQFESDYKTASLHKGVIKNKTIRRQILKDLETWFKTHFEIVDKTDSAVAGAKGNVERFYVLKPLKH